MEEKKTWWYDNGRKSSEVRSQQEVAVTAQGMWMNWLVEERVPGLYYSIATLTAKTMTRWEKCCLQRGHCFDASNWSGLWIEVVGSSGDIVVYWVTVERGWSVQQQKTCYGDSLQRLSERSVVVDENWES